MANNTLLILYTCTCDRKKVNKSGALQNATNVTDTFRIKEKCSILNPVIELATTTIESGGLQLSALNYAYIERFNRYYFITDIKYMNDNLVELTLDIDVLMTYAGQILNSSQEVTRAESINSKNFIDTERPVQSNKLLYVGDAQYLGTFPESTGNNYIMTVAGGVVANAVT